MIFGLRQIRTLYTIYRKWHYFRQKQSDEHFFTHFNENINENEENTSLAAPGALAHRLQRRTACNAEPPASVPQDGRRGLERCLPLGFGAF